MFSTSLSKYLFILENEVGQFHIYFFRISTVERNIYAKYIARYAFDGFQFSTIYTNTNT